MKHTQHRITDEELQEAIEWSNAMMRPSAMMLLSSCDKTASEVHDEVWQKIADRLGIVMGSIKSGGTGDPHDILGIPSQTNVKEHAPLSAGASVDHGVEVETTGEHVNRAADRGCCVSTCCASSIPVVTLARGVPDDFINTDGINPADIPERLRKMAEITMKALDDSPPQTDYAKMLFSGLLCNIAHIMPWDGTCDESRSHIRSWLERNDPTSRKRDSRISNDPHQTQSRS